MLSLLKTEWLKIKSYRTFWVILILYVVLFPAVNIFIRSLFGHIQGNADVVQQLTGNKYAFPEVWKMVTYFGGFFLILPVVFIIIYVTNEYEFRTHRQNVINGWSRNQFITAKLLVVLVTAVVVTFITIDTGFFLGLLYTGSPMPSNIMSNFYLVGNFFVAAIFYLLLGFVIAILFKRSGLSILLFLLFTIIIVNIIISLLNKTVDHLGDFFLSAPVDSLVPNPFVQSQLPFPISVYFLASAAYIILFTWVLYWRFKRVDL